MNNYVELSNLTKIYPTPKGDADKQVDEVAAMLFNRRHCCRG